MNKTIIIAEAGINHNGSFKLAKKLVDVAAKSGADYVKFQTFKTESLLLKKTPKAPYQKKNTLNSLSAFDMGKSFELSEKKHIELKNYCKKKNIKYLTTFHDLDSLKSYKKFDLDFIKIASGDINNLPYLEEVSKIKKKTILSTGLSNFKDIKNALKILTKNKLKKKDLILLQCNSAYPTPTEDVNLNCMAEMKKKFKVEIGFSDHTEGIIASIVAVAMGARVIEKHFTLNKKLPGPDHKASLSTTELNEMVKTIRKIEMLKGKKKKSETKSELKNKEVVRKSIVTIKNIKKGEKFTIQNIGIKRPSNGMSPMLFKKILKKKSSKDYLIDKFLNEKI